MTATTVNTTRTSPLDGIHLSFLGQLRSEWIKLRSLRSTVWCSLLLVVGSAGFAGLMGLSTFVDGALPQQEQNGLFVQAVTAGVLFTGLIAAILGVLVVSGEYATGMIRTTYTAAPGRISAYIAKAIVLTVATFVVGLIAMIASVGVFLPFGSAAGVSPELSDINVLLPVIGGAAYLAGVALLAFSFGAIVRSTAGGIAIAVGLLFVAPIAMQMAYGITGKPWAQNVNSVLPSNTGAELYNYTGGVTEAPPAPDGILSLSSGGNIGVFVVWIVVFLIIGAILTKRRDV